MAAVSNGIAAYGMLRPFCATFLNFVGYALGAVRVSALSELPTIYIATHDSIGLGEVFQFLHRDTHFPHMSHPILPIFQN